MKFQIWMAPEREFGVYSEKLADNEAEALQEAGFVLEHEFEACTKANAEAYFISWCDEQTGAPNRVEYLDFKKAGLR